MNLPSVGTQLAQARSARRLTLQEVTQATKIQTWVLEAVERDQLLPSMSPVYAKGFVMTYAKFLGLDPAPLVAQLLPPPAPVEPAPPPERAPSDASAPSSAQWDSAREALWLLARRGGMLALGIGAVLFVVNSRPLRQLAKHTPAHKAASLSVVKQKALRAEPPPVHLDVQPLQSLELVIQARKQTWISIKADGNLVAQQKLVAGAQETWKARRRFEVVIGAPGKVDVLLNGHSISPMALAHHGRLAITHSGITPLEDDVAAAPAP